MHHGNLCISSLFLTTLLTLQERRHSMEQKKFFTRYPDDIGELLLQLFANLNDEIAMSLANSEGNSSLGAILNQLMVYRHAAEMLTGAPYGSVVLYDLDRFPAIIEALKQQKNRLAAQNG